jgi:2-haloacid dehalogenase
MYAKPKLLIFDVNETLLDLTPLKDKVNAVLENENAFDIWFRMLLHYSLVETTTGVYKSFGEIGKATFQMQMGQLGVSLSDAQIEIVLGTIRNLPPHPDVIPGLTKLRDSGFSMMALTNSSTEAMTAQLKFAGIDDLFDTLISIEEVERFKPHPATYNYALDYFKVPAEEAMMIAAHAWDIVGAQRCGLQTAFILRPGKQPYPMAGEPDISGKNLLEIVKALAAVSDRKE